MRFPGGRIALLLFVMLRVDATAISRDKTYSDTGHGELPNVVLTSGWRRYEILVENQDLSRIMTGFVWSLASPGRPVVFYLDDIRWE